MKFQAKVIPSGNATVIEIPTKVMETLGSAAGRLNSTALGVLPNPRPNNAHAHELLPFALSKLVAPAALLLASNVTLLTRYRLMDGAGRIHSRK
jgi:hypothetical protein